MHLNKHIFWSQQIQKHLIYEAHFSFQNIGNFLKIQKNLSRITEEVYVFLDNLLWSGNGKFSLLLRVYS